jgi:hypothetical protein
MIGQPTWLDWQRWSGLVRVIGKLRSAPRQPHVGQPHVISRLAAVRRERAKPVRERIADKLEADADSGY